VQLVATVEDQESGHDRLLFLWSAGVGTIIGNGLNATWQAPTDFATPADPAVTLTVVENYQGLNAQGQIVSLEHRVTRSVTVHLHNSVKELADMGRSFLQKFANSSITPAAAVVDFSDSCPGKQDELEDIEDNRENYFILGSQLGEPRVSNLTKYQRADITISCSFQSRRLKCPSGSSGCTVGEIDRVSGTCRLTAIYERARWWLCDSRFSSSSSISPGMRLFFGADTLTLP
jgi:hypothetical protein